MMKNDKASKNERSNLFQIPVFFFAICWMLLGCHHKNLALDSKKLEDGIYLVLKTGTTMEETKGDEQWIKYNLEFFPENNENPPFVLIQKNAYAPLFLKKKPTKTQEESTGRTRLFLELAKEAEDQLEKFTEKYIGRRIAIVVGGQALTLHGIKAVIRDGKVQISRCTDNACEYLYTEFQDNVLRE